MKKKQAITTLIIAGLLALLCPQQAHAVTMSWQTFMGSTNEDESYGIAVDSSGNVYVTGYSYATWGTPINAHTGGGGPDAFVAKYDSSGTLLWNTFMGSSTILDFGNSIAVDSSGNVYVTGYSYGSWGSPINAYAGGYDVFVAKLNTSGTLLWNTFMGSANYDYCSGIAVDSSGNMYVTGYSDATWGSPIHAHAGGYDTFVAKLNSSGTLLWNTFTGSSGYDRGQGVAVDSSGNVYVSGDSYATWGSPINVFAGYGDVFVAKLNSSGTLLWNTFMGSSNTDWDKGIAVDSSGNVYVTGQSDATWGSPIHAHAGSYDTFVAKLNSSGTRLWNTFMGSAGDSDGGLGIAVDSSGNMYVTGYSDATWGSPLHAFAGSDDAFVAKLNTSGTRLWHTFMGSANSDVGCGTAVDSSGNVYVTGYSDATWGSPIHAFAGIFDAFVAKFQECIDDDNDGYGTGTGCLGPDCDDTNASIHPGATEVCNGHDDDCDGQIDEGVKNTYYRDADGDGYGDAAVSTLACAAPAGYVANASDNCPNKHNPRQLDADNDGIGDVCDPDPGCGQTQCEYIDTDGDGVQDYFDNCPTIANYWQKDSDHDGIGDACDSSPGCGGSGQPLCEYFDTDNDRIQNRFDNCPTVYNPLQLDADHDGTGDACDPTPGCGTGCGQTVCEGVADTDHDFVIDILDNCPAVCNAYQLDGDHDGTGDVCDADPGCGGTGEPECEVACSW